MSMFQRNACFYSFSAVKWLVPYSLIDKKAVIMPMEKQCIIMHLFVGRHVSSILEHCWAYQGKQTKIGHFPKHTFPRNKISEFGKMKKWTTFLTLDNSEIVCRWMGAEAVMVFFPIYMTCAVSQNLLISVRTDTQMPIIFHSYVPYLERIFHSQIHFKM